MGARMTKKMNGNLTLETVLALSIFLTILFAFFWISEGMLRRQFLQYQLGYWAHDLLSHEDGEKKAYLQRKAAAFCKKNLFLNCQTNDFLFSSNKEKLKLSYKNRNKNYESELKK